MPEYVYGLHDFSPENEDEVPFRAGEPIEVVEKDDEYGDGWWQGRNLAGKVGLFPQSYTTSTPPSAPDDAPAQTVAIPPPTTEDEAEAQDATKPALSSESLDSSDADSQQHLLHTLDEESEPESIKPKPNGHSAGAEKAPNGELLDVQPGGGVMDATMTDVQKAIEQLGRRRDDGDGDRSFSFASTGDGDDRSERYNDTGGETDDTDFDMDDGGEGWHKGARRKLAEKARRAVEEAEKLEMIGSPESKGKGRLVAPPIEVEMSDESDDEHGDIYDHEHTALRSYIRGHPHIPEESEEDDAELDGITDEFGRRRASSAKSNTDDVDTDNATASSNAATVFTAPGTDTAASTSTARNSDQQSLELPSGKDEDGLPTVTRSTFHPVPAPVPVSATGVESFTPEAYQQAKEEPNADSAQAQASLPTPISPNLAVERPHSTPPHTRSPDIPMPVPLPITTSNIENRNSSPSVVYRESLIALPSPTPSSVGFGSGAGMASFGYANQTQSRHASMASSAPGSVAGGGVVPGNGTPSGSDEKKSQDRVHPSEWSVDEVVEWLKSRGFDQDVCDKFTEQEITGDVLLELDANLLKTEIGILAFGKRVRIANAITELRRPPSFIYDRLSAPSSPMHPHMTQSPSQIHSPSMQPPPTAHSPPYHAHSPPLHSPLSAQNLGQAYAGGMPIPAPYPPAVAYAGSTNNSVNGAPGSSPNAHSRQVSQAHSFGAYSSAHQSLNSPGGFGGSMSNNGFATGPGSEAGASAAGPMEDAQTTNGHGEGDTGDISDGPGKKSRPTQLNLSPSDGALGATAKADAEVLAQAEEEKALSESEAGPPSSVRRRFFGGSSRHSGASSKDKPDRTSKDKPDRNSKDSVTSPQMGSSPTIRDGEKDKDGASVASSRHARNKRSIDAKPADRLSLFGSISGGLGKSRKPPPRYSAAIDEPHEKSTLSLSRFTKKSTTPRTVSDTSPKTSPKFRDIASGKENKEKDKDAIHPSLLRKRAVSTPKSPDAAVASVVSPKSPEVANGLKDGQSILEQIGEPDHNGWMRKKSDRYNSWKMRYFVLKGPHLYCLRSNSKAETKIKGYIHIVGYKVTVDENVDPGRYGFKIEHDHDKTHFFSSEEKTVIRDWMKAIMKATIGRDYTKPVVSSCNIPTIPLMVAQAMNPAPRPPSPTARDATQKALRRENPHQLSSRDARVLMGLPSEGKDDKARVENVFADESPVDDTVSTPTMPRSPAPPRPSREARRLSSQPSVVRIESFPSETYAKFFVGSCRR
ncbi:hypothetical protein HGRIS_010337 [Hohenbuehelia grisea]|uniref:Uncharacterized protein n=1 Tax=Hohenbuehelia grisea TaxID=104357 RepID=A0ABR3J4D8_9AGAR